MAPEAETPMKRMPVLDRVPWHVVVRGARRLQLFHDPDDYKVFLAMLRNRAAETAVDCAAYALLSNHAHACLFGNGAELSDCMRQLDRGYSGYHNKKYGLGGHTFDRSYFAQPIRNNFVLQRVARYIHLNPVRAGLASRPEEYLWTDYSRLIQGKPDGVANAHGSLLRTFKTEGEDPVASYVAFTEAGMRARRRPRPTTKTSLELWQEQFLWVLELAESRPMDERLDAMRAAVMAASSAGIPPRAMGLALGHANGLKVSQIIYRTRKLMDKHPELASVVAPLDIL